MKRLFQHYEGRIQEIQGLTLKRLIVLVDSFSETENIILLWIQTEKNWLRVFIDGSYCGVDEYETNESISDLDDDVSFKNYDDWVRGLKIRKALVESGELPSITLIIEFTNGNQLKLVCNENEICSLMKN